ncbi:hypothetical protein K7X08_030056 [Anisodus acutangulus]|uniref:Patatin n=1 Tax=Anisodus acutangulus TaxID=402998 RepID=A0A9Q1LNI0_9SOLA|nr:hypothetical protein K7X08_030056 [Anisodus acutangulus]
MTITNGTTSSEVGEMVTILSIDGGAIKGIIPDTILAFLEGQLQYIIKMVVVIGKILLHRMLSAPNPNKMNRPFYAASDIVGFYFDHGPKIFSPVLMENLGETRLHQTLTNVIIPSFDINNLLPTIFFKLIAKSPYLDAKMSDICISTSAAPNVFPPYFFENDDGTGNMHQFNMIDGAVASDNPALIALSTVTKRAAKLDPSFAKIKPLDVKRILLLSLGTGAANYEGKYKANEVAKWGAKEWLKQGYATPIVDIMSAASHAMIDDFTSTIYHALDDGNNYLRVQEPALTGSTTLMDDASEANMNKLVQVGENLLKKPVSKENPETNEEALKRMSAETE